MKVTSIKQQVKNPQRVSVFIDGKYSFSLSLDELVTHKLKQDDELSAPEVKKYKKLSADGKLRARALEWLLNRPHSEREFKDYLYRKKAEPEQIKNLIKEFGQKGYLDNAKFAEWFIELRARHGKSNRAIRSELFSKGIGRETIDQLLAGREDDEMERLKSLVNKKKNLSRYRNDPQKLMQYLVGKGFDWQKVKEVLAPDRPENT